MTEKIVFYLLPAVAGILIDVLVSLLMVVVEDDIIVVLYKRHLVLYLIIPMIALVLLGAIVFSFHIYQNMAALQEERAEKIILENQITQMQGSMVEMEHLYDGVRSVKHNLMQSWFEMLVHPPMNFIRQDIFRKILSRRMMLCQRLQITVFCSKVCSGHQRRVRLAVSNCLS